MTNRTPQDPRTRESFRLLEQAMKREVSAEDCAFTVEKGVLRANVDLYWEHREAFEDAAREVLGTRRSRIEVDLTAVNFISSSFLDCLSTLVLNASRLKKRIALKVTLDVSWLFDIMGAQRNIDMEVL